MNNKKVLDELKEEHDVRYKTRVIYVSNSEQLDILNDALRDEWSIKAAYPDYKGGIYYTIQIGG